MAVFKGAIEVSVGFLIIIIVSALVLIFIMGWLGNIFPTLTKVGDYATAQAQDQMMNKFAESSSTDVILATIPVREKFSPGSEVPFKIGVRKTADVDTYSYFAICIGVMESTSCKTPTEANPIPVGTSNIEFKFSPVIKIASRGTGPPQAATMIVPTATKPGVYGFKLYVCPVTSVSGTCNGLQNSYGTYDFIVEVK